MIVLCLLREMYLIVVVVGLLVALSYIGGGLCFCSFLV